VLAVAGASTGLVATSILEKRSRDTIPNRIRRVQRTHCADRTRSPAHQHAARRIGAVAVFTCLTGEMSSAVSDQPLNLFDSDAIAPKAILFSVRERSSWRWLQCVLSSRTVRTLLHSLV